MPPPEFIPNNVWSSATPTGVEEQLTLPSGQTCTAVRLGVEGLVHAGILDHADELTAITDKHVKKTRTGKVEPEVDSRSVMRDPESLRAIITIADKALPHIVTAPLVRLHYVSSGTSQRMLTVDERAQIQADDPGVVFTDQVGLEDKMWLFDWAIGNLAGMRAFREEPDADVAGVANEPGVSRAAKRTAGRSKKAVSRIRR
jgi:hypothetical protein